MFKGDLNALTHAAVRMNENAFCDTHIFLRNTPLAAGEESGSFAELQGLLEKAASGKHSANRILFFGSQESPSGLFFSAWIEKSYTGEALCIARLLLDKNTPEALCWAQKICETTLSELPKNISFEVPNSLSELFPAILKAGCFIETVKIAGLIDQGVHFFSQRPKTLDPMFRLRTAEAQDVNLILDIYRKGFEEKFGWFVATEANLSSKAEGFKESIARGDIHWLVENKGVAQGYCQVTKNDYKHTHFFGPAGGIEPVLLPEIRGQGVSWFLYQEALNILKNEGQRSYLGNTAQPAIMHIGRALGRRKIATHFRKEGFFASEHFSQMPD